MDEKPIDHERILKITKLLKGLDLAEKEIALSILSNILTVYVEVAPNRSIAVRQEEDEDEPGFTVSTNAQSSRYSFRAGHSIPTVAKFTDPVSPQRLHHAPISNPPGARQHCPAVPFGAKATAIMV